jgi:glutamine synthetase
VRAVAQKHGLRASFVPKIFPAKSGNGCHLHLSLWHDTTFCQMKETHTGCRTVHASL